MKFLTFASMVVLCLAAPATQFELHSADIPNGSVLTEKHVAKGFGCSGDNQSPDLSWSNPPEGTKSFALTVFDPDAPTGSGWWHWTVFNIPADVRALPTSASPKKMPKGAVEGRTDFGSPGFGGACPPVGDKPHRYIFTLYALKVEKLPIDKSASGALVSYMARQNSIGQAKLEATYSRSK